MTIHDEVVASVAALAALDTEGIVGMAPHAGGFGDLLRRDVLWRGIRIQDGPAGVRVDAFVVALYGVRLPEMARQAAANISQSMQEFLGVHPERVTVHVAGIRTP